MVKTIFNFIKDIEDGLVSQDNFNQGICNFFHQLAPILPLADEQRGLFTAAEQETRHASPALRGALLFRSFVQAMQLHRGVVEARFKYETSVAPQDQLRATSPALLSGLRGLVYLMQHEEPRPYRENVDQTLNTHIAAMGDLVLGAYFSARSTKHLEPLGISNPTSVSHANADTQVTENTTSTRSLGDILDALCGTRTNSESAVDSSVALKQALAGWLFLLSNNNFEKLKPHLSKDETTIVLILLEWWSGSIDFPAPSARLRLMVLESALSGTHAFVLADNKGYQSLMLSLFYLELTPHYHIWAEQNLHLAIRGKCARAAAAQRLAMSVYQSLSAEHSLRPGGELGIDVVHQQATLRTASHKDRASPDATISSCGWLQNEEAEASMPFYLWDVQQRRTISSQSLTDCVVKYTAISHTWGRWKTDGPCVHVDGVDEWTVPQNTKFNVTALPHILASAGLATRYVWFDLLCIPQEPESECLVAIARHEIARQAKIFRSAMYAVAWINDVEGWHGLHVAVNQQAIQYLRAENELPPWTVDFANGDDGELELFRDDGLHGEVNGWFSSLWTLQELCLRPDMMLADRDWNFFAINGYKRTVVGIDDLVALSAEIKMEGRNNAPFSSRPESRPRPPGDKPTLALDILFEATGLALLSNASQATILMLGYRRYCTANRAEAIMSAVGATDWYATKTGMDQENHPHSPGDVQQSQQGRYPLPFVREAARKIGPKFYASKLQPLATSAVFIQGLRGRGMGTLMPFGTEGTGRTWSTAPGTHAHPSVRTWAIQSDYSVDISQAAIIAYTGQQQQQRQSRSGGSAHNNTIIEVAYVPLGGGMQKQTGNLAQWVDGFYPQTRNFAVCLYYGRSTDGVLLKETVTGDLVKVGAFWFKGNHHPYVLEPPETCNVSWHVL